MHSKAPLASNTGSLFEWRLPLKSEVFLLLYLSEVVKTNYLQKVLNRCSRNSGALKAKGSIITKEVCLAQTPLINEALV